MEGSNTQYQEVLITHFVLHINNSAHARSVSTQIDKSLKNKIPGLVHGVKVIRPQGDGTIRFILPYAKTKDGKTIKYILPEGGAKIVAGRDLREKIKADQRKLATASLKI